MPAAPSRTSAIAREMAVVTALDFGAVARCTVACARLSAHSGRPMSCTACAAAIAVCSAVGSAMPTSSLAKITRRRAMNRGSSPASSMRAR